MNNAPEKRVIFGISGSISAYKSLDIIRLLRKLNIAIQPILSASAHQFVTPWSVESLAESTLIKNDVQDGKINHLSICKAADAFIVCPASANTIAKLAQGLANDMLTASFLSFTGPKVIFPAMHTEMYQNPITQQNLSRLRESGVNVIEPTVGDLASGDTGIGRLPDVNLIADIIQCSLFNKLDLTNQHIVVTSGGTSEAIDSVRCISNHASGRSGHIIANMAAFFGAKVSLIRTNHHPHLDSIITLNVTDHQSLEQALLPLSQTCDKLIMNAAVSDFTITPSKYKLNRGDFKTLTLTPTNDILKQFNQQKSVGCKSIGFCLHERDDLIEVAKRKMLDKKCDVMIANDTSSFGQPYRTIHIIDNAKVTSQTNISLHSQAYELLKL